IVGSILSLCLLSEFTCSYYYFLCFFFQAEDGIRDLTVTGVQTCALPIFYCHISRFSCGQLLNGKGNRQCCPCLHVIDQRRNRDRSEERRVGKECRSRWSPYQ